MMRLSLAIFFFGLMGLGFMLREPLWVIIGGPADQGRVYFEYLSHTGKPNDYLVCPADLCTTKPDAEAPIFNVPAKKLLRAILDLIPEDIEGEEDFAFRFVAKTPLMRYPDTISIRILAIDDKHSTIAIYSRSLIGYSDMGANKARVESLLSRLQASLASAPLP